MGPLNGTDATTESSIHEYAEQVAAAMQPRLEEALRASLGSRPLPAPEVLADLLFRSPEDLVQLVALSTPDQETNQLTARLGPFWSQGKVAKELAGAGQEPKTRSALRERRVAGTLLGLRTSDNQTVYPVWQFHRRGGAVEVKPAVRAMLAILRDQDPWAVGLVFRSPAPELADRTPLDLSDRSDPQSLEKLRSLARRIHSEWAA